MKSALYSEATAGIASRRFSFSRGKAMSAIAALFSKGRFGVWYDPYDLSTMWQDTARTIPVTGDNQIVRYLADKSGNKLDVSRAAPDAALTFRTDGINNWLALGGGGYLFQNPTVDLLSPTGGAAISGLRVETMTANGTVDVLSHDTLFQRVGDNAGTLELRNSFRRHYTPNVYNVAAGMALGADAVLGSTYNANTLFHRRNGAALGSLTTGGYNSTATIVDNMLYIGFANGPTARLYQLVYAHDMTAAEITAVEKEVGTRSNVVI